MKFSILIFLILCYFNQSNFAAVIRNPIPKPAKDVDSFSPIPNKFTTLRQSQPCPRKAHCVPPVQCPGHLKMIEEVQICDLPGDEMIHGICCTTGQNHSAPDYFQFHEERHIDLIPHIIQQAIEDARIAFNIIKQEEDKFRSAVIEKNSPSFFHNMFFRDQSVESKQQFANLTSLGMQQMLASRFFKDSFDLSVDELQLDHFRNGNLNAINDTSLEEFCRPPVTCPNHMIRRPFRQPNGFCNHLGNNADWGAANTVMSRLLPPAYMDGIWEPRTASRDGIKLKSARLISQILFPDVDRPHSRLNLITMQFGQFLSHDIVQTAVIKLRDDSDISCCTPDGRKPLVNQHFACMPIVMNSNDEFYSKFGQTCMNFVRLAIAPNRHCRFGYAKIPSKVTHFIDGSAIYGSDQNTQFQLRSFRNGQLKVFLDGNREMLPLSGNSGGCVRRDPMCFMAGDVRVNQQVSLVALHMLFAREHNRIAKILGSLNPHWNDEMIFQETRRIVIAELQHVTYNEYLNAILGKAMVTRFKLDPKPDGFSFDYDNDVNPSITHEFSGAAFRFGHSTVQGKYELRKANNMKETVFLPEVYFNPSRLKSRPFFDELLQSLAESPMQMSDSSVTQGLSRFLFNGDKPFGFDLVSINIQRGRDHALRPYNDYLELMGFKRIKDFREFGTAGDRLSRVYKSPDDIDLYVGGLLEVPGLDSAVGSTFKNIIADQFSRLKRGDRYFYEYPDSINPGAFSSAQLKEIKKVTMARIICDNADGIVLRSQSPQAFLLPTIQGNEPIDCKSPQIPTMDLSQWQERRSFRGTP